MLPLHNTAILCRSIASVLLDGQTPLINNVKYFSQEASGDFTELKVIAEFVLFFCAAFRMSVCLRAAAVTAAELTEEKSARRFLLPFAVAVLITARVLSQNIGEFAEYLLRYIPKLTLQQSRLLSSTKSSMLMQPLP